MRLNKALTQKQSRVYRLNISYISTVCFMSTDGMEQNVIVQFFMQVVNKVFFNFSFGNEFVSSTLHMLTRPENYTKAKTQKF